MRVFVLGTGRNGSKSLAYALDCLKYYYVIHEPIPFVKTLSQEWIDDCILIDGRFAWFLPVLEQKYPDALWVDLVRSRNPCIESIYKKTKHSATFVFNLLMLSGYSQEEKKQAAIAKMQACTEFHDAIRANIDSFLVDKPHITIQLEDPEPGLKELLGKLEEPERLTEVLDRFAEGQTKLIVGNKVLLNKDKNVSENRKLQAAVSG